MAARNPLALMQAKVWNARLPLEIRLAASECRIYDRVQPYLISCSRLTYLPSLLPRLLAYFLPYMIADSEAVSLESAYFEYDSVPLKWHLPIGLLYDVHILSTHNDQSDVVGKAVDPFRLTIHFAENENLPKVDLVPMNEKALNDAFINAVKEADFLRSGTAKPIMSLSAADSKALWTATQENDLGAFSKIHYSLLPGPGQLRNIPIRVYIPSSNEQEPAKAHIKILQGQFAPSTVTSTAPTTMSQLRGPGPVRTQVQTLGTVLHAIMPGLFPSRRTPLLARPILHGAQVPMAATLEDLSRMCCYADGWLHVVVSMTS